MLEDDVKTKDLEGVRQTIMKVASVHYFLKLASNHVLKKHLEPWTLTL